MNDRSPLFQHIKFFIESKNIPAALRELRRELDANPDDPQILFWLGVCLAEIKEFSEAGQHLERAASLDPANTDIVHVLEAIQKQRGGEELRRPVAAMVFDVTEPVEYKKKECPNCHRRVGVESWQCGYCKQIFFKRILIQLGITFAVASFLLWAIGGWYSNVMGITYKTAEIVNKAGDEGKRIQISNAEWNCVGLGLFQASGVGGDGTVRGKIKNIGDRAIEKATITIFFRYDNGNDITFVWFDVFSWKSGLELQFEFPGIRSPARPDLCDLRIEYVQPAKSEPTGDLTPEFYVPSSDHFLSYRFSIGDRTLSESLYSLYKTSDPWTFGKLLRVYVDMIPAFLFNYFCVMLAVILVNVCDPERKWNTEWQMDAIGSAFVVIGFVVLNMFLSVMGGVMGMLGPFARFLMMMGFAAKLYLFYLFFRRSIGFTFVMIVFYICLTLGLMGLWFNIADTPKPTPMPQIEMDAERGAGGLMPPPNPQSRRS